MTEWLDLMIEEIRRKRQEAKQAEEEREARNESSVERPRDRGNQSK